MSELEDLNRGVSEYKAGSLDAAVTILQALAERTADKNIAEQSAFWLGYIYRKKGMNEDALTWFRRVANMKLSRFKKATEQINILERQMKASEKGADPQKGNTAKEELGPATTMVLPTKGTLKEYQERINDKNQADWWSEIWGKYPLLIKIQIVFNYVLSTIIGIIVIAGLIYLIPLIYSFATNNIKSFNAEWNRMSQEMERSRIDQSRRIDEARRESEINKQRIEEAQREVEFRKKQFDAEWERNRNEIDKTRLDILERQQQFQRDINPMRLARPPAETPPPGWCSNARSLSERTICGNSELIALDEQLRVRFGNTLESAPRENRASLNRDELDFLRARDSCGSDVRCLRNAYRGRLRELP